MPQGRVGSVNHRDVGCEKANIFLGVKESRCEWCPFSGCIDPEGTKGYSENLKDLYRNWEEMLVWTYQNRNVTPEQLGFLFSTRIETVKKILEKAQCGVKTD